MRWSAAFVIFAVVSGLATPGLAPAQLRSLSGTTPGGAMFDRLNDATTRPVPTVPPPTVRPPQSIWVPDRYIQAPGRSDSPVFVPGHWEQRISDHEVYTPPLTGRTREGGTVDFPAGTRPPVNERQEP